MNKNGTFGIVIHGGCGSNDLTDPMEKEQMDRREAAMQKIIVSAWELLSKGGSALDVAERAVNLLEEEPAFNAGIGGALTEDRQVELDASIMNGDDLSCGAVAGLLNIPHTISVARRVMEKTNHVFLHGKGANEFAKSQGFAHLDPEALRTEYQLYLWGKKDQKKEASSNGTVGAVVRDARGTIVAATSTGGMTRKMSGRIGDSPMIGAGTYADSRWGGISLTGYGEQIIKIGAARTAIALCEFCQMDAEQAIRETINRVGKLQRTLSAAGVDE